MKIICGLVGVAGKSASDIDKMFRTLLILDIVRGEDSTGVLLVDSHGDTSIHKVLGSPYGLFDSRVYTQDMAYANNVLMGHNRWASKGAINKMNAHPFEHGHLIGAHNGTLSTQYLLDDSKDYDVDSDNIFHHMEKHGVKPTCKLLGGAFALSWYDSDKGTINFVRNDARPLSYAYTKDKKSVVWASEKWMLVVAADKAHVKLGNIMDMPVHKHHSLVIPKGLANTYKELGKFKIENVERYVLPKKNQVTYLPSHGGTKNTGTGGKPVTELGKGYFKLINKWVDFTVKGTHPMYKHMIEVHVVGYPNLNARIVCKARSNIHKKLLNSVGILFQGLVGRVNQNSAWSISIKSDTIEEVLFEEDDYIPAGKYPVGFPLTMKSLSDWEKAVQRGCAWCSDVPQGGDEAKHLTWFSSDEHVCPHCAGDIDIKRYLHLD